MRVGFDISQVAHQGGVASYTKNLSYQLSKVSDLEMVYFYSSLRKSYKGNLKNVKSFKLPPTFFEILFNKFRILPIEKFLGSIDIYHSSDWVQPPTKAKKVTTYHDVIPLKYPQWSHPKIVAVHKRRLKIIENEIDSVIAVSEATKNDLLEVSNIPAEKIVVIREAASEQFKPQSEKDILEFKKTYNLPEKFILAIGGGERRNLRVVEEAAKNYNLVITGKTIPWMDDTQMPLLYSSADLLLYPSLYEGFGLPILEAMACGTPVITSNVSSMPEVGGNGAIYVDPNKIDSICKKVKLIMEDKKVREDLIKKGFENAKKFSWKKCAEETVKIYKKVLNK